MICLEVSVNGVPLCTAGVAAPGQVGAFVAWVLRHSQEDLSGTPGTADETMSVSVTGQVWQPLEFLSWPYSRLKVGDEVAVRVVEREHADAPTARRRHDRAMHEKHLREQYERLKRRFEPANSAEPGAAADGGRDSGS